MKIISSAPESVKKRLAETGYVGVYKYEGPFRTTYIAKHKNRQATFRTLEEAIAAKSKMALHGENAELAGAHLKRGQKTINVKAIMKALRCRTKAGGIELLLDVADIEKMAEHSKGFCQLTGIQFSDEKPEGKRFRPWMPSIDRIESNKPYDIDNCRMVCAYANIAINDLGEDEFYKLAKMFIKTRRERDRI